MVATSFANSKPNNRPAGDIAVIDNVNKWQLQEGKVSARKSGKTLENSQQDNWRNKYKMILSVNNWQLEKIKTSWSSVISAGKSESAESR